MVQSQSHVNSKNHNNSNKSTNTYGNNNMSMRIREKLSSGKYQRFAALQDHPQRSISIKSSSPKKNAHQDSSATTFTIVPTVKPTKKTTLEAKGTTSESSSRYTTGATTPITITTTTSSSNRSSISNHNSSSSTRSSVLQRIRQLQQWNPNSNTNDASSRNSSPRSNSITLKQENQIQMANSKQAYECKDMTKLKSPLWKNQITTTHRHLPSHEEKQESTNRESLKNALTLKVMQEAQEIEQQIQNLKEKKLNCLRMQQTMSRSMSQPKPRQPQSEQIQPQQPIRNIVTWNTAKSNADMAKEIIAKRGSSKRILMRRSKHTDIDSDTDMESTSMTLGTHPYHDLQDENRPLRPTSSRSLMNRFHDVNDVLWNNGRGVRLCMDQFRTSQDDDNSLQSSVLLNPIASLDRIKQKFEYDYEERYCYSNESNPNASSYYYDYDSSTSSCSDEWNETRKIHPNYSYGSSHFSSHNNGSMRHEHDYSNSYLK